MGSLEMSDSFIEVPRRLSKCFQEVLGGFRGQQSDSRRFQGDFIDELKGFKKSLEGFMMHFGSILNCSKRFQVVIYIISGDF